MIPSRPLSVGALVVAATSVLLAALSLTAGTAAAAGPEDVIIDFHNNQLDYLQGTDVVMYFNATRLGVEKVEVSCGECPIPSSHSAPYGPRLRYPIDFGALRSEPRWSGTYTVRLLDAFGNTVHSREFNVHAVDAYLLEGKTTHPLGTLFFQASGFLSRARVDFEIWHLTEFGQEERYRTISAAADASGKATLNWVIPLDIGPLLHCPRASDTPCRDFWVEPKGAGKAAPAGKPDRSGFRIEPVTASLLQVTVPGETVPTDYNRTEEVKARFHLLYAGYYPVTPVDMPKADPRVLLGVYRNTTPGLPPEKVDVVYATFSANPLSWTVNWTIPRDIPYAGYQYFLRVEPQEDRHRSTILQHDFPWFAIHPVDIEARFVGVPKAVQRTEEAFIRLDLFYKDGKPLTPDKLHPQDTLRACLVPSGEEQDSPCLNEETFPAVHVKDGTYRFRIQFPRDEDRLQAFRLHLVGNVRDNVQGRTVEVPNQVIRNSTTSFAVIPAKLRTAVATAVAGSERPESEGFERGDRVTFVIDITYPDGSPFNVDRNRAGATLPLHLFQKNSANVTTRIVDLPLRNIDRLGGRWVGELEIPLTGGEITPGRWEFIVDAQDLEDPPNQVYAPFYRDVRTSSITVAPEALTPRTVLAGTPVKYTFRLLYPDGSLAGTQHLGLTPRADVYTFTRGAPDEAVYTGLIPTFDPSTGLWSVGWTPPRTAALTSHVFVIRGADGSGNRIHGEPSVPFDVYVEQVTRRAVTQPLDTIVRNDQVFVVFEGADGDTGEGADGRPRIEVQQRLYGNQWIVKSRNVYATNASLPFDHLGAWTTTTATALGEYRFALYGRSADRAVLVGLSETFNVTATSVTREVITAPPTLVAKGSEVNATFQRFSGDLVNSAGVYRGTFFVASARITTQESGAWRISWAVPFTMDVGTYTFQVQGRDAYGNPIRVAFPLFLVGDSGLSTGSILSPPPKVPRGEVAKFTFRVLYPDGKLMTGNEGLPSVSVRNDSGAEVQVLQPRFVKAVWEVTWAPALSLPVGDYRFVVTGSDNFSNPLRPLESEAFAVVPGRVLREFTTPPERSYLRLGEVFPTMAASEQDALISFTLAYLGRTRVTHEDVLRADPIPVQPINYTWDPILKRYSLRTRLPIDVFMGFYTIDVKGVDRFGNTIFGRSEAFEVRGTTLQIQFERGDTVSWAGGQTTSVRFKVRYGDGTFLTPDRGKPYASVVWNTQPLGENTRVTYQGDHWLAEWDAPPLLPEGRYYLELSGSDNFGNPISASRAGEYFEEPSSFQRIFGTPGPGPLAGLAALGGAALVAAFHRRRGPA